MDDDWAPALAAIRELTTYQFAAVQQRLEDMKTMLDERYAAQTKAVDTAFLAQATAMQTALTAAERAVAVALLGAEKAVTKAETAADKRFDLLNELRENVATREQFDMLEREIAATRMQLSGERSVYATRQDLTALRDYFIVQHQPVTDFMAKMQGRIGGISDGGKVTIAIASLVLTAVIVGVALYGALRPR